MKNKDMEKNSEIKTVVPALRFPEFITGKHWYISKVKDIYQITRGLVLAVSLVKEIKDDIYIYPVYSSQTKNGGLVGYYKDYLYENAITWTTDGANAGDVNYRSGKFYCTNVCGVLLNQKGFSNKCMAEIINSVTRNYVSYVGNPKLMNGVMGDIIISVPPTIEEQQKIADCLSSLDELIEATTQKVKALKEHKKGLMQRLFPAEGKNVPDLRFPEFQGQATEWQSTLLGAVVDYENGRAHENEIDDEGDFIVVNSKFISTDGEVVKRTNTPYCLADKEDILMVLSDVPNGRAIAKCFFIDQSGVYTVNQRICRLRSKNVNSKLLFYLINRNPYFLSFDDGVKQTNLKKNEVLECPLMIPSSPIEQQKIADLLSSIDDLIIATEQRIKSLEKHKKGLMQQLFPNIL